MNHNFLLSDAGGQTGRQEKPSQCHTVSSLIDRPQGQESGGERKQSQWDLIDNDGTLIGEPSEYAIWRDILVQQKPSATGSDVMKTSRTWTQA